MANRRRFLMTADQSPTHHAPVAALRQKAEEIRQNAFDCKQQTRDWHDTKQYELLMRLCDVLSSVIQLLPTPAGGETEDSGYSVRECRGHWHVTHCDEDITLLGQDTWPDRDSAWLAADKMNRSVAGVGEAPSKTSAEATSPAMTATAANVPSTAEQAELDAISSRFFGTVPSPVPSAAPRPITGEDWQQEAFRLYDLVAALRAELARQGEQKRETVEVPDEGAVGSVQRDLNVIASRLSADLSTGVVRHSTSWCVNRLTEIAASIGEAANAADASSGRVIRAND